MVALQSKTSLMTCASSLLFMSLWAGSHATCSEKTRVRKPWHALTDEEQLLYSRGFQRMHREGTLILFFESHDDASDNYGIHTTTQNFFWHSYWLWEMENSFRDLGEEYECFTLPYWDVTHDAAYWYSTDSPQIDDLPIYNSHLGGNGNIDNDYCVEDEPWTIEEYNTEYLCADDETSPHCCLKRYHEDTHTAKLSTRQQMSNLIYVNKTFNDYEHFFKFMNYHHAYIHEFVGSVEHHTHFNPTAGEPEVDPLFPLFHAFIDYIRLMHTDCYNYDQIAAEELEECLPNCFKTDTDDQGTTIDFDYVMTFSVLCDGTNHEGIRLCSDTDITPRLMYDMSPNRGFNIVYELGEFWSANEELQSFCADNLNSTWWKMSQTDQKADEDQAENAKAAETEEFVVARSWHSGRKWFLTSYMETAAFSMLIAMAVLSLLRLWGCSLSPNKRVNADDGGVYGAVSGAV